jgi:O-antigen ligase
MIPFLEKRIRGPLVLAVLAVVLAVVLVGQVHGTRFVTQSDESAASRDVLRQAGIAIALDHPIIGIGAYEFERVSVQYASRIDPAAMERSGAGQDLGQLQPHNDFVYLAACYGIPALLAFIVLLAAVALALRDSYRATSRPFIRALSIGLIGAIVAYLVNAYYHNCLTSMPLIWVLVGLALAVAKLSLNEKKMLRKT